MKIKNVLVASAIAFGLVFSISDGMVFASDTANAKVVSFAEFAKDKEQYAQWEQEHLAHIQKIQELKDEKRIKHMEYKAFKHNPNAGPDDISKAARDVVTLDRQIKTLNAEFLKNSREKYGLDFAGLKFHKDMTPCFKKHMDQYGEPMRPHHMGSRHKKDMRPCPFFGEKVPPHMRHMPPHHFDKNVPPHMRGHVPPHAKGEVPPCFDPSHEHFGQRNGARFDGLPPHLRNIPETQAFDTMQTKPAPAAPQAQAQ